MRHLDPRDYFSDIFDEADVDLLERRLDALDPEVRRTLLEEEFWARPRPSRKKPH
jgi:hypothetical protein